MKIAYFLIATFVVSSCTSTKKFASSNVLNSNAKAVTVKSTNTDSTDVSFKNMKDSSRNTGVPETLKVQLGKLIPKKPF